MQKGDTCQNTQLWKMKWYREASQRAHNIPRMSQKNPNIPDSISTILGTSIGGPYKEYMWDVHEMLSRGS